MKTVKANLKIIKLERLHNSYYGNPKYRITAEDSNGDIITGVTASNAAIGYIISNHEGATVKLQHHTTKTGNIVFTNLLK